MVMQFRPRLLAMQSITIGLTLLAGFGVMEAVLRSFPELIGVGALARIEPSMRAEIAGRLGLPTLETAIQITPKMRIDGGPTIFLPAPNSLTVMYADAVDLDLGAVEQIQVDENGLCNDPQKANLAVVDILVAGDSFTFCTAIPAADTAAQKLQNMSGLTVYNAGVRGTGPDEYLEMMKRLALVNHPRIAVMNIYEGNDLRDVLFTKGFLETGEDHRERNKQTPPAWSYAAQFIKASVGVAKKLVKRRLRGDGELNFRYAATAGGKTMMMNVANHDQDEVIHALKLQHGEASLDVFEGPLGAFVAWAKSNGIEPVVTYIPSMYTAFSATVRFEDAAVGSTVQAFSTAQRQWFAGHAGMIGFHYIDLTPFFQQATTAGVITHFPGNVHLTPQGHEIVALNTWNLLQKLKLAPRMD